MENRILANTEPVEVFRYFEDLTRIPRESGNEAAVCAYLVEFAKAHNLEYQTDEVHNIIMRKPAGKGFENHPGIVLQAHMDMVCEKNAGCEHDFETDPIQFVIEDDKIVAKETTLGADDGIGMAFAMAVLADDTKPYPPLEFVCTADEERGMTGVEAFDGSLIHGSILINLDSNDEGVFVVGCAGGPVVKVFLPIEKEAAPADAAFLTISVKGLLGGHSGEDIHRGRANSNKLLTRLLETLKENVDFALADFTGGLKYNAIPREAEAVIAVAAGDVAKVREIVAQHQEMASKEYWISDADIVISCAASEAAAQVLTKASRDSLVNYLYFTQSCIIRMNPEFPDIVESSVNLGVVRLEDDQAVIQVMTRSSMKSMYEEMFNHIRRLTELFGGTYQVMSNCPEWEYDPHSGAKQAFEALYEEMYGKKPQFLILHAGLECGELGEKVPHKLDMISMGPDARNLHSPGESLGIISTQRAWKFFQEILFKL